MTDFVLPEWVSLNWVRALVLLVVVWPLVHVCARILQRALRKHSSPQAGMVGYQLVNYGGGILLILTVMTQLGFKVSTILGAAGIAGVAIGFAAQTSLSNLISGIFLIWEKPFQVDDVIKIGSTMGVVMEIDLLSTKIRAFDNTVVRVPNENLIKSELTTITKFPIRRMDVPVGVAYKEDVRTVMRVLREVADANPFCLDEPEPLILFKGFGNSSLDFMLGLWFSKTDYLALRNSILPELYERFQQEGIEIPFPHVTLYTGSVTEPFPITMVPPEASESRDSP
jgi:small-conductance mechanosensitive channel